MIMEIVKHPNPLLTQRSKKAEFGTDIGTLVQNMMETMNSFKDPPAAGLSAVQVGNSIRIAIVRDFIYGNNEDEILGTTDYVLINPKIISLGKETNVGWEGCLSFPDLYGKVERATKIKIKYQNQDKIEQRLTASGFLARVIQHEMDHLDGITFDSKIIGKMYKGAELEAGTKVAD